MAIYRTADIRQDFNDHEADTECDCICCICNQPIYEEKALFWDGKYAHEDSDCSYEFWREIQKAFLEPTR